MSKTALEDSLVTLFSACLWILSPLLPEHPSRAELCKCQLLLREEGFNGTGN